jgi:putative spermidine/putrescine transport system permease protein
MIEKTAAPATKVSEGRSFFLKAHSVPIALLPFFAFVTFFLLWPISDVLIKSLKGNSGEWTLSNFEPMTHGIYLTAFQTSIELGLITAFIGAVVGAFFAFVIENYAGRKLTAVLDSISAVFANSGGVPLAFMFIASFGANSAVIRILRGIGLDLYANGFSLFSLTGVAFVYSFFQIPLMVLVFKPALKGLRKEWREASMSLGGSNWDFIRRIAVPVLFPSFFGSMLLLFAGGFSAYATARAMTVGNVPLVPLIIGTLVDGNVIANKANQGAALAVGMILVAVIAMTGYVWAQRTTSKWQAR